MKANEYACGHGVALSAGLALVLGVGGCFNAPPPAGPRVDPELAQESAAARVALDRGANDQAVALYRRALDRAREMDDAREIGKAAYNLAASLVRDGKYDAARTALREAESETVRGGGNTADVLLLEGKVAQLRDEPPEALTFADRVMRDPESRPTDSHRVQVHLLRGEVAMDLNQPDLARKELSQAQRLLGGIDATQSPALRAGVLGLSGRVSQAAGDAMKAAAQFDQQATLLRQAGLYRDMARALARAGAAYRQANQAVRAADRLYRAGRSFAAQEDTAEANRLLAQAADMAEKANDGEHLALIRTLRQSMAAGARPTTGP